MPEWLKIFKSKDKKVQYPYIADWKVQEHWEDYPMPNYDIVHTYCSVAFDDSGKTFYYRTRNPNIRVGDLVYVPVGRNYEKTMGVVVDMEDFLGHDAPFPLERTKYILERVNAEEETIDDE